jgi:L-alanine-DL-glutamate epimerase-like enolase superfamily enzyme
MKITRIRAYQPARANPTFNHSDHVVMVETDEGLTGIGEGGCRDMLEQCAAMLIGEDPARIQHLWQLMYRGWFYPPGREKLHALGALDLALWDIKGKALGVPVYDLLGGLTRDHVECYAGFPWQGSIQATARACMQAGFRAYRGVFFEGKGVINPRSEIDSCFRQCQEIAEGVGPDGAWMIDVHTRLDLADAVRLCTLIEPLNPLFVEDPLRSENPDVLTALRSQVRVPIAVGEQFGDRWDASALIERHVIDYTRMTLPNTGGITEWMKIAALCETHYVGMIPHATGPIATSAVAHVLCTFPGPAIMEAGAAGAKPSHILAGCEFHDGKLWPVDRPGLGVEFDPSGADLILDITEHSAPIPILRRPDGSLTNW